MRSIIFFKSTFMFLFLLYYVIGVLSYAQTVRIAAAANMTYALKELTRSFAQHYADVKFEIHIGGSGKLRAQIENGAQYDIFLSANTKYPDALYSKGFTDSAPIVYAKGALVLLSVQKMYVEPTLRTLKEKAYKRIAIANPKTAPYGKAAVEALKNAHVYDKVQTKLIYGESISQTVIYTLKAAQGGIIAASALYSPQLKHYRQNKEWVFVDPALYTPIIQSMVLLKRGASNKDAVAFFQFLQSTKAKKILKKYGYQSP